MSNNKKQTAEQKAADKELRSAGVVPTRYNFVIDSGRRLNAVKNWTPRLRRIIVVASVVSGIAMASSLASVLARPDAMVFVSFPDGTTRCAPQSLNPKTGKPMARQARAQAICNKLNPVQDAP